MLKTKELIELLKKVDPVGNCNVYLQSDAEGNSYSTMTDKPNWSVDSDFNAHNGSKFVVLIPFEEGLDYENLK